MRLADDLLDDLIAAVRSLSRSRGTAVAAALALALGIGAATAVFSGFDAVLLRPLPLPAADRLALVWHRSAAGEESWLSWPEVEELRGAASFAGVAALRDWRFNLTGPGRGEPEEVAAVAASADLFAVTGGRPLLGRPFTAAEDRPGAGRVVLLGHELWRRRFGGDRGIVGRAISLDGAPWTVAGVLPPAFRIPPPSSVFPRRVDLWVPLGAMLSPGLRGRDVRHLHALARLRPGAGIEAARAEVAAVAARWRRERPDLYAEPGWGLAVVPLAEQAARTARPALLALAWAVALLVAVACVDVAHLLLARNAARARELAVRAALGASRARLARQLLAESLLLAAAGTAGGIALAAFAVDLLAARAPAGMLRLDEAALDGRALAFAAAAGLATALLFGVAPAVAGAGRGETGLKGGGQGIASGRREGRTRRFLAASEAALALVLLVLGLLLARAVARLAGTAPGFAPQGVLTLRLSLPPERYPTAERRTAFFRALAERAAVLPGVVAAGAVSQLPLSGAELGSGFAAGEAAPAAADGWIDADLRGATPGYFRAMGIPLLAGRGLAPGDVPGRPPVALVDVLLARRLWPGEAGEAVVGKRLRWRRSDVPLTVVGVVGAVRHAGPGEAARPTAYFPQAQYSNATSLYLVVRSAAGGGPGGRGLAAPLRREVRRLDPAQPVADLRRMEERLDEALGAPRFSAGLTGAFALAGLALALVGIYGVVAFAVARRTREIGVRVALGADRAAVARLALAEGLAPALAGAAAGLPLAAAAAHGAGRLLFGVAPLDPASFLGAALLLAAGAALACVGPARRAAAVDPVVALTAE